MPDKCKERERISASSIVEVPALPVAAVRGQLCFRCFSPAEKITKCAGCKRAGYCSRVCQKIDWAFSHKKQCKVLREVNELDLNEYRASRTWDEYRMALLRYVRLVHGKAPVGDTQYIVQAQPYCIGCRRSGMQLIARGYHFKPCSKCRLVFSCSDCNATHSDSVCAAYDTYDLIARFRIHLFEDVGNASVVAPTASPRTTHKALKDCAGWYDYFTAVSDKEMIAGRIHPDFSQISDAARGGTSKEQAFEENRRLFMILAVDNLTMPLTIVAAIEDLSWTSKTSLNVHLLGPTQREFLAVNVFEEILHLLPALQTLSITAVGPSSFLNNGATRGYQTMDNVPCCPTCESLSRTRPFASFKGLYHDFASSPHFAKPDLIVAFNSGCADGDDADSDWQATIRLIVESGVPALFTTYNEMEASHERARMQIMGARFVVEPEENRWRGLVPSPEFLDTEFEMWYQNNYRYIVQGKSS